ncbi:hypothetical protein ACFXPA_34850 [Amycolatopsis sp. NPDC059090]|uniref:hypothetical protein n=1 Tax=unclassified Amycolatopsis TaxID=2618356 RepID=UPI00366C8D71
MTAEPTIEEAACAAAGPVRALRVAAGDCGDSLAASETWSAPDAIRRAMTATASMIGDLSVVLFNARAAAKRTGQSDLAARLAEAEAPLLAAWTRLQTPVDAPAHDGGRAAPRRG